MIRKTCPQCSGSGTVADWLALLLNPTLWGFWNYEKSKRAVYSRCPMCRGTGAVWVEWVNHPRRF